MELAAWTAEEIWCVDICAATLAYAQRRLAAYLRAEVLPSPPRNDQEPSLRWKAGGTVCKTPFGSKTMYNTRCTVLLGKT